jgi:hypothetical protein
MSVCELSVTENGSSAIAVAVAFDTYSTDETMNDDEQAVSNAGFPSNTSIKLFAGSGLGVSITGARDVR